MLEWNEAMMKMIFSLLFSLPGIPLLRYGDEIGMADDVSLKGRESVRTSMQWVNRQNGGFSKAKKLKHPVIEGDYGYEKINVLDSINDPSSFLNWVKQLIGIRKQCQEIIEEPIEIIKTSHASIIAYAYRDSGHQLLLLHNLSTEPVIVDKKELNVRDVALYPLLSDELADDDSDKIVLNSYSYKWFKIFLQNE
jgi:maltose alpha-D-glucosyltransferase / alpha-amylase